MTDHQFGKLTGSKTRVEIQPGLHALIPAESTPPIRDHTDEYGQDETARLRADNAKLRAENEWLVNAAMEHVETLGMLMDKMEEGRA